MDADFIRIGRIIVAARNQEIARLRQRFCVKLHFLEDFLKESTENCEYTVGGQFARGGW